MFRGDNLSSSMVSDGNSIISLGTIDEEPFETESVDKQEPSSSATTNNNKQKKKNTMKQYNDLDIESDDNASSSSQISYQLGRSESRWVLRSKIVMLVVLVLTTVGCGYATHRYISRQQEEDFIQRFEEFAEEVLDVSQVNAIHIFETYEAMCKTITIHASAFDAKWPFYTIPEFEFQVLDTMEQSDAKFVSFSPLVSAKDRSHFERFVQEQRPWKEPTFDLEDVQNDNNISPPSESFFYYDFETAATRNVSYLDPQEDADAYNDIIYAPVTQMSPITEFFGYINYNTFNYTFFPQLFEGMMYKNEAILSDAINLYSDEFLGVFNPDTPKSILASPVYDIVRPLPNQNQTVVGVLMALIPWRKYFNNLIPKGVNGISLVVRNICDENIKSFSYIINGAEVNYVGDGDIYDRNFEDYEVFRDFTVFKTMPSCRFTLHVFPSETYADLYQYNRATPYTIAVVVIFVATALVFVIYDCIVERRQRLIMHSTSQTNAIINSLFPATVRDRLIEQGGERGPPGTTANVTKNSPSKPRSTSFTVAKSTNNRDVYKRGLSSIQRHLNFLSENQNDNDIAISDSSMPIADLFPNATVFFCDIVGFTAWSSEREPTQVFQLLETIYSGFDRIARKLGVFKVETIGDCYMAATGIPDPRHDHAIVMVKFAKACLIRLQQILKVLEVSLGPGTSDLNMRVGIHSGPVTAGVLRGEKSRFQLFGDTVNTAARMESTGQPGQIQFSKETADLLVAGLKAHWIVPRDTLVDAKGKGKLQTYWLVSSPNKKKSSTGNNNNNDDTTMTNKAIGAANKSGEDGSDEVSSTDPSTSSTTSAEDTLELRKIFGSKALLLPQGSSEEESRLQRVVRWNVDVLCALIKRIVAMRCNPNKRRNNSSVKANNKTRLSWIEQFGHAKEIEKEKPKNPTALVIDTPYKSDMRVLDEAKDVIEFPGQVNGYKIDPEDIEIPEKVVMQLKDYVETIAMMYPENPFHNFFHASHVTQSVTKLLSRIVSPDIKQNGNQKSYSNDADNQRFDSILNRTMSFNSDSDDDKCDSITAEDALLHDFTYGITSDPMTQFACVFSAIIHDVDHPGVPNCQLMKEDTEEAKYYKKSVAEQRSLDISWKLLMEPDFADMRAYIFETMTELKRFRQLVVNCVMATDVIDKELNELRRKRWESAFSNDSTMNTTVEAHNLANDNKTQESEQPPSIVSNRQDVNRKATIVIEHLIQASDVSHTMQHWHVYAKWNEKLFHEMYKAYLEGRAENDPSENWYQGEIGFFDFYVIPLAKKLKECGVFGVSSDEYLTYARANRMEWADKGKSIVESYVQQYRKDSS